MDHENNGRRDDTDRRLTEIETDEARSPADAVDEPAADLSDPLLPDRADQEDARRRRAGEVGSTSSSEGS